MGRYIQTDENRNKARAIRDTHGGIECSRQEAFEALCEEAFDVICVIDNGLFEAAAGIFSKDEWDAFHDPKERRYREYVLLPLGTAKPLTERKFISPQ